MNIFSRVSIVFFMCLAIFGCSKKVFSGIEGTVVDGKGSPMQNVKVMALQEKPVQGYGQFESFTGPDGKFSFRELYPSSAYTVIISPEGAGVRQEKINSGPEGRTAVMPPAVIRILIAADGMTTDTKTGLMWAPDPGRNTTWDEARKYASSLKLGGYSDWRLPTRAELKTLTDVDQSFPIDNCCAWSSEMSDSKKAWYVNLTMKFDEISYTSNNSYSVLAVRSPGPSQPEKPVTTKDLNRNIGREAR